MEGRDCCCPFPSSSPQIPLNYACCRLGLARHPGPSARRCAGGERPSDAGWQEWAVGKPSGHQNLQKGFLGGVSWHVSLPLMTSQTSQLHKRLSECRGFIQDPKQGVFQAHQGGLGNPTARMGCPNFFQLLFPSFYGIFSLGPTSLSWWLGWNPHLHWGCAKWTQALKKENFASLRGVWHKFVVMGPFGHFTSEKSLPMSSSALITSKKRGKFSTLQIFH